MSSDLNKGISSITYNSLNLPKTLTAGTKISNYVYAATGKKLTVEYKTNSTVNKKIDYVGNMIYEGNASSTTIKRILIDGGYIEKEGSAYNYYFNLTDHLGNVRVVADATGTLKQSNHYYPFGMAFAEGVATSQQPYKYNGKELDSENGLNWYDYDARYMDPALGRFTTVDPHAENYYSTSPYSYVRNNPLRYIDPDGKDEYEFTAAGFIRNVKSTEYDSFHKVTINKDGSSTRIAGGELILDKKVVTGRTVLNTDTGKAVNFLEITGDGEAKQIFEHFANNSTEYRTEYGLTRVGEKNGEQGLNMLGVNAVHEPSNTAANVAVLDNGYTIREAMHNHPSGNSGSSLGDVQVAGRIQDKFPNAQLFNYTKTQSYTQYDRNTPVAVPTIQLQGITISAPRRPKP